MVFIVSDQRIATENFEKGKIYKVVFFDESIFYGVCLGIGSNFVMLSGNISGYLFPLTMETASQVESIDLYTPVEPEPPLSQLLQYQTGVPPFSFNTSGLNLWSYYIQGAAGGCGERTENFFDSTIYELVPVSTTAQRMGINLGVLPGGEYTLNAITSSPTQIYHTIKTGNTYTYETITQLPYTFTADGVSEQIIRTAGQSGNSWADVGYTNIMLNTGSIALPFEPYGYKIPIVCGGQTTNIYIDNPLGADDILYSTQTGIQIPTIVGDNTLSVNTTVQPSEMQIVYKIADR